jgi:hypothetical protein
MRLDLESIVVGPSASRLSVMGIIDWSTIAGFRARLSDCVSPPRPDILVDMTGLLSWCPEAQQMLQRASMTARLHGGRLVVVGLPPIPRWETRDSALPLPRGLVGQLGSGRRPWGAEAEPLSAGSAGGAAVDAGFPGAEGDGSRQIVRRGVVPQHQL